MLIRIIGLILCLSILKFANANSFFATATFENQVELNKIFSHPFNIALNQGSLPPQVFKEFIAQDSYYLMVYENLAQGLYNNLPKQKQTDFLLVESLYKEKPPKEPFRIRLTSANKAYTTFLLDVAKNQPKEVLIAAMLPCQWLYQIVYRKGKTIHGSRKNPYQSWLSVYQSKAYHSTTKRFIQLSNEMYQQTTPKNQKLMLEAFSKAVHFEYQFWDEVYGAKS